MIAHKLGGAPWERVDIAFQNFGKFSPEGWPQHNGYLSTFFLPGGSVVRVICPVESISERAKIEASALYRAGYYYLNHEQPL